MSLAAKLAPLSQSDLEWVCSDESRFSASPWGHKHFHDALAAGYGCVRLDVEGMACGYAVCMTVLDEIHLLTFGIRHGRHRRGYGRLFLALLIDYAKANGGREMLLEVRESNAPALRLYEQAGFVEIGVRRDYYPTACGMREAAIVMRKELSDEAG